MLCSRQKIPPPDSPRQRGTFAAVCPSGTRRLRRNEVALLLLLHAGYEHSATLYKTLHLANHQNAIKINL